MKPERGSRRLDFFYGVAAALAALAVPYVAGTFLRAVPYAPAVVATLIVRYTPGDVATKMIESLGHWAMRLLVIGVHIGILALAGWLALRIRRPAPVGATPPHPETPIPPHPVIALPSVRSRRALAVSAVAFVAALLLGLNAPGGMSLATPLVYLVSAYLFARIAAGVKLTTAVDPDLRPGEAPLDAFQRSRRRFVVRAAAAVGGLLVGGAATLKFLAGKSPIDVDIAMADEQFVPPPDDDAFPAVEGLSPEITPNTDFYTVDINIVKPSIDHESWKLRIHGLVESPYELDYRGLQSDFEVVEMAHTLTCISNEVGGDLISTAVWRGVRLKDVLDKGGLKPGVEDIVFRAAEGYSDSITLEKALEPTTLVVFGMNGAALPRDHGFPARIIVPGIYGMKNVKWLTAIEAVDHDYQGYWMVRGWSDTARIRTQSRIDAPRSQDVTLPATLAGVAWAGDREVMSVEVSEDGGSSWKPAILKRTLSPVAWRLWAAEMSPGSGQRTVLVRATDGNGELQDGKRTLPHPSGATGYHRLTIDVR